jgi:hypothetical protein
VQEMLLSREYWDHQEVLVLWEQDDIDEKQKVMHSAADKGLVCF